MGSRIRAWMWQGPHQVAQKSTTTTWPGKSAGPSLRPSRVLSRKSGLAPTALLPPTASLQPKSISEKSAASIRMLRGERARWGVLFIVMASQAYGKQRGSGVARGRVPSGETAGGGEGIPSPPVRAQLQPDVEPQFPHL